MNDKYPSSKSIPTERVTSFLPRPFLKYEGLTLGGRSGGKTLHILMLYQ